MTKAVSVSAWIKIDNLNREANYIVSKGEWNQAYSLGLSRGCLRWSVNGVCVQTEQPLELHSGFTSPGPSTGIECAPTYRAK